VSVYQKGARSAKEKEKYIFGKKNLRQWVSVHKVTIILVKYRVICNTLFYFNLTMMTESKTEPLCDGIN
jgi:hypothetical protein